MTTKQEIIDFVKKEILIRHSNLHQAVSACDEVERMIKDLRPEIKVKKLVWKKLTGYDFPKYCTPDDASGYYISGNRTNEKCYVYDYNDKWDAKCSFHNLEQAKDWVQAKWNEYVLSLVEVEPESLPNGWAEIKDPDKWLHENGFRTELGEIKDEN